MIYFIQSGDDAIKIGYTGSPNPSARLSELQISTHHRLRLIAVLNGDRSLEETLHKRFCASHIRGEWFRLSDELKEFLATVPPANECEYQKNPRRIAPSSPERTERASIVRAARKMLGWDQGRLAAEAGLSLMVIKNIERETSDARSSTMDSIFKAFSRYGLLFLQPGDTRNGGRGLRFTR